MTASLPQSLPSNVRLVGLIFDAEHAQAAGEVARQTKNAEALALIAMWQRSLDRFSFAVVGGRMHRADGYVVGGLGSTWDEARALFALAMLRFDEIAEQRGEDFSSAWLTFVSPERAREVEALIAEHQQVAGHA
jgi:hypothetical protein